ncbi:MAG: ATP-binding protein [Chlamydiales bacterium]|nr:ATP-binding protein [Chlamydiales bacterium]
MDKHSLYIPRAAEQLLKESVAEYPACLITGPRQAGKSTLMKQFLSGYTYVTLDDLDVRDLALNDPKRFLQTYPTPVVIDEIQYAPNLLSYIKMAIDKDRGRMGQFVLTGSQTFQVMDGVSESLAGRVDIFDLYPLTWKELLNDRRVENPKTHFQALVETIFKGFYPELHVFEKSHVSRWFRGYIKTYLERDVRDIKAIPDLSRFQKFIRLLAPRVGQLLNLSEVAKEAGIASSTAKDWLSILESTYIIYLLKPFHNNTTKRLVKSPKLYFYDTGLLCYMLGIESTDQLQKSPFCPSIFENMVIIEVIKGLEYTLSAKKAYYFRTTNDLEIDLVIAGVHIEKAIEIKYTMSPNRRMAGNLNHFKKAYPDASVILASLATDFPGLPHCPDVHCLNWLDFIMSS